MGVSSGNGVDFETGISSEELIKAEGVLFRLIQGESLHKDLIKSSWSGNESIYWWRRYY